MFNKRAITIIDDLQQEFSIVSINDDLAELRNKEDKVIMTISKSNLLAYARMFQQFYNEGFTK